MSNRSQYGHRSAFSYLLCAVWSFRLVRFDDPAEYLGRVLDCHEHVLVEVRIEQFAPVVVHHVLQERLAGGHDDGPLHLAMHRHWINRRPAVVVVPELLHVHLAGIEVHVNLAYGRTEGICG